MTYRASWSNRFEIKPGRWVYEPTPECRKDGQSIIRLLKKSWEKPPYYYHLRTGGHVAALSVHLRNHFFATIDISDFFGCISRSRVTRSLKPIVGYDEARKIAKRSTIKAPAGYPHSHHLPYGFNQSPVLATIALFDSTLGRLLDQIHNEGNTRVSIYMDDIVISSRNEETLLLVFEQLKVAAKKSKFLLNRKKTRSVSTVTEAFNIEITYGEMKIQRDRFVKFQQAYSASDSEPQKHGIGSYVGSVNKAQAKLLI